MTDSTAPLVAIISATLVSTPPVQAAFEQLFPEATVWNILDDRLLQDADARGGVTSELQQRMRRLIAHAVTEGADAVLLSCSLYGFVAHEAADELTIPIFGPDDAAFAAYLSSGLRRVWLVGSVQLSVDDSAARLAKAAERRGISIEIIPVFVAEALATSKAGDAVALARSVATKVRSIGAPADSLLLAQYSLAPAAWELGRELGVPVFSGPERSASAVREAIGARK
jgi:hypothetical protein